MACSTQYPPPSYLHTLPRGHPTLNYTHLIGKVSAARNPRPFPCNILSSHGAASDSPSAPSLPAYQLLPSTAPASPGYTVSQSDLAVSRQAGPLGSDTESTSKDPQCRLLPLPCRAHLAPVTNPYPDPWQRFLVDLLLHVYGFTVLPVSPKQLLL